MIEKACNTCDWNDIEGSGCLLDWQVCLGGDSAARPYPYKLWQHAGYNEPVPSEDDMQLIQERIKEVANDYYATIEEAVKDILERGGEPVIIHTGGDPHAYVMDKAAMFEYAKPEEEEPLLLTDEVQTQPLQLTYNADPVEDEVIEHPSHYAEAGIPSGIECWDHYELAMTEEEFAGAMKNNIYKYTWRTGRKDPAKTIQDLEKAGAYIKRWIKYLEGRRVVWMEGHKSNDI